MKASWWTAALLAATLPALAEEPAAGEKAPAKEAVEAPAPGYLGVKTTSIDPEDRTDYGLKKDQDGLLLLETVEGGPAAKAGLQGGDVLLTVDDKPVGGREAFGKLIRETRPGTELKIRVLRKGKEEVLPVTVGALPKPASKGPGLDQVMAIVSKYQASGDKLREKYIKDGLSPEEASKRVQEDLQAEINALRKGHAEDAPEAPEPKKEDGKK